MWSTMTSGLVPRVMGLDVGEKRIGVALSDPLGMTAQALLTIETHGIKNDVISVVSLAEKYRAVAIVCGLPRNMDGSIGFQAQRVQDFCALLEAEGLRIIYQDERLTTASARHVLIEANVSRKKRKGVIDKMAAGYILQGFLDAGGLSKL